MIEELARVPLFEGLDQAALEEIARLAQPRHFQARAYLCRQGEPGNSLLVIRSGLAEVFVDRPEGANALPRLRPGDVIGEISLLTGEPRSANVRASVTTEALELSQGAFAALADRHPAILVNLSRILSRRLARPNLLPQGREPRGEAVALVVGERAAPLIPAVIDAARNTSPGTIAALDLTATLPPPAVRPEAPALKDALTRLDALLSAHTRIIMVVSAGQERLGLLLEHVDRIVLLGTEAEVERPAAVVGPTNEAAAVVLITEKAREAPRRVRGLPVIRAFDPQPSAAAGGGEIGWLGRYLSRTRLGLALGAGGAKGYAHVGVLQVLQEASYPIDAIAGSSIGALVGTWLALGQDARAIEATMRRTFTPENVQAMFRTAAGASGSRELMARLWRETTNERSFSDLSLPLVVMSVDLDAGRAAPITEGPLWEALLAAMAIPGFFPPYERRGQRLVDGVALVPVPTSAAIEAGADIAVAVNVMNREKVARSEEGDAGGDRSVTGAARESPLRTVDALMDVMELTWRDSSIRHAALADVVIAPRFGRESWRAFEQADRFIAAGRAAAREQLEALRARARPLPSGGGAAPGSQLPASSVRTGREPGTGSWELSSRITLSDSGKEKEGPVKKLTLDEITGILTHLFGRPALELPDDLNASFEDLGLDSIAFIELQIEIEQRYALRISVEEAQQIRTIGEAIDYVNRRLEENEE